MSDNVPDRVAIVPREELSTVLGAVKGMLDTFERNGIRSDDIDALAVARSKLEACLRWDVGAKL